MAHNFMVTLASPFESQASVVGHYWFFLNETSPVVDIANLFSGNGLAMGFFPGMF